MNDISDASSNVSDAFDKKVAKRIFNVFLDLEPHELLYAVVNT
jgi:hypothetical protein